MTYYPLGQVTTQYPPGYTAAGQIASLGNANFANFRPQYSLPGSGAATPPGSVQAAFPGISPVTAAIK